MKTKDSNEYTTLIGCRICQKGFKPSLMRWHKNGGLCCKDCYSKDKEVSK